jgi:hypothetical protein
LQAAHEAAALLAEHVADHAVDVVGGDARFEEDAAEGVDVGRVEGSHRAPPCGRGEEDAGAGSCPGKRARGRVA